MTALGVVISVVRAGKVDKVEIHPAKPDGA